MGFFNIVNTLCNFLLPALVVGSLVALVAPWIVNRPGLGLLVQCGVNTVLGTLALAAGLWFFGTDGKMATYLGMALLIGSAQWVAMKGWQ